MGKKYIVEIGRLERLYKAYVNGNGKPNITWLSPEVDLTPYTEPDLEQVKKEAYDEGYADAKGGYENGFENGMIVAWDAARKIIHMPEGDLLNIFTECYSAVCTALQVILKYDAPEAIEKIRQYEQEQEEYHIGDEVIRHYKNEFMEGDDAPSIFLSEEDGNFRCIAFNGRSIIIAEYPKHQYRKTGRHFPEIATVLEKMRGEQDG